MPNIPAEILPWATPLMTLIVVAYIRSMVKKIDTIESISKDLELLKKDLSHLQIIKQEWTQIRVELSKLMVEMDHVKKSNEDVVILKRDIGTVWQNIDKLKDAIFDEEYRSGGSQ